MNLPGITETRRAGESPEITEIQRWALRPGDRLLVRTGQKLSPAAAEAIKARVRAVLALPDDFPVLVLDGGMSVEVAGQCG